MPDTGFPPWLDNVDTNTVGVFTLDDGERLTADVLDFNDKRAELNVEVISSNRSSPHTRQRRTIPVDSVISFEPRPRAGQPWPYSDPCRSMPFSGPRLALMTTLFLTMIIGGMLLFGLLPSWPYAIQAASAIIYTIFVVFFTFARTGSRPHSELPSRFCALPSHTLKFSPTAPFSNAPTASSQHKLLVAIPIASCASPDGAIPS